MKNEEKLNVKKLSDYLYILFLWKNFIIINFVLCIAIIVLYSFLIPNNYKSTASVILPPENAMGISGLGGLISGKTSSISSKLLGITSSSNDIILGILNSRSTLIKVINEFKLFEYYEVKNRNYDRAIKSFQNDLSFETNEFSIIEINVVNENPVIGAKIANRFVELVDSINININSSAAKNNRLFIEKRYFQNVDDLKKAEDSLFKFQKKYGIVAVPEQLEVSIKAAADIEAELLKKEMEILMIKQSYGENSPHYLTIQKEISLMDQKVKELKNSSSLSSKSNVLFSFKDMPNIALQYLRTYREVEIQQSILEIVMPMYEQAKVEEQKSIPTVIPFDKAVPSQEKYSPRRSFIILGLGSLSFFILVLITFHMHYITSKSHMLNPLEEKEFEFYYKIKKLFRIL